MDGLRVTPSLRPYKPVKQYRKNNCANHYKQLVSLDQKCEQGESHSRNRCSNQQKNRKLNDRGRVAAFDALSHASKMPESQGFAREHAVVGRFSVVRSHIEESAD